MIKFGLIGCPVAGSLSPLLFKAAYGGRYPYELMDFPTFREAMDAFMNGPYRAVNVTAPYKKDAALAADARSEEVQESGCANILVKTASGVCAHNSDILGVRMLLPDGSGKTAAVIGTGGAGMAAVNAAEHKGFSVSIFHHDEIAAGVKADLIIYTLPKAVEGIDRLECGMLLEANYRTPCLEFHPAYVSGKEWLLAQAISGYGVMTGETPDSEEMKKLF